MSNLKPCPFCGCEYTKDEDDYVYAGDHQDWCPLGAKGVLSGNMVVPDDPEYIEAWNKRATTIKYDTTLLTDLTLLRNIVDAYAVEDDIRKAAGLSRKLFDGKGLRYLVSKLPVIDPRDLAPTVTTEINLYDKEEIHHNCTVQVWMNTETGQTSIGWWPEGNPPPGAEDK